MKKPNRGLSSRACKECRGSGRITVGSGACMRQQRKRLGLSLREVARRMGFSAAYICDLELGRRPMNKGLWQIYALALRSEATS